MYYMHGYNYEVVTSPGRMATFMATLHYCGGGYMALNFMLTAIIVTLLCTQHQ